MKYEILCSSNYVCKMAFYVYKPWLKLYLCSSKYICKMKFYVAQTMYLRWHSMYINPGSNYLCSSKYICKMKFYVARTRSQNCLVLALREVYNWSWFQAQRLEEEGSQGRGDLQQSAQGSRYERNGKKIPWNMANLFMRAKQLTRKERDRQTGKYIYRHSTTPIFYT